MIVYCLFHFKKLGVVFFFVFYLQIFFTMIDISDNEMDVDSGDDVTEAVDEIDGDIDHENDGEMEGEGEDDEVEDVKDVLKDNEVVPKKGAKKVSVKAATKTKKEKGTKPTKSTPAR